MSDNVLLRAALEYARRGWSVLPLNASTKAPEGRLVAHGHNMLLRIRILSEIGGLLIQNQTPE